MRLRLPLALVSLSLALVAPLYAQSEDPAQSTPEPEAEAEALEESEWDLDQTDLGIDDEAAKRLAALFLEAQNSIEGVEAFACPVDDTAAEAADEVSQAKLPPPVQDYEPTPAMWKISDEDTTIHLFGTFHILPEGFEWRTPLLESAIAESEELVLEMTEDDFALAQPGEGAVEGEGEGGPAAMSEFEQGIFELVFDNIPEKPIFALISERNKPKLAKMVFDAGLGLEEANFMPPMLLMFAFGIADSLEAGSSAMLGVETVLSGEFEQSGRPISAIEDPMEVLSNLLKIDQATLIASLDAGLDEWDPCDTVAEQQAAWTLEHAWAKGEVEKLLLADQDSDPFTTKMGEVLLTNRNRQWAAWVKERMERPGTLLLAVGAGHMAGPDSLVLMLEADGLSVERVQ